MDLFAQVILSGLAAGAVYGVVGLGFSLLWRLGGVLDLAHGELVTGAAFVFLAVLGGGGVVAVSGFGLPILAVAAAVALAAGAGLGVLVQLGAVRPYLGRVGALGWIAGTAAAGLLVRAVVQLRFPEFSYSVPDVLAPAGAGSGTVVDLGGGLTLPVRDGAVLALGLVLGLGLDRWLASSRTGRAMQAAADEPDAARLVGVDPQRLQLVAWAIAGLLAAAGGLLLAPERPLTLSLGVLVGLKGIAAAVLGRLGSPRGAIGAGLALGVAEALAAVYWTPAAQDLLAPALLVLALAAFPARLVRGEEAVE